MPSTSEALSSKVSSMDVSFARVRAQALVERRKPLLSGAPIAGPVPVWAEFTGLSVFEPLAVTIRQLFTEYALVQFGNQCALSGIALINEGQL